MRRDAVEKSGFFEEYLGGTSMVEEPDYAYRVLKNGYKIYFDSSITIFHYPQENGNKALTASNPTEWLYNYFFNLLISFVKHGRIKNIPLILAYYYLLMIKHTFVSKLTFVNYITVFKGFIKGIRKGYELFIRNGGNPYYTPLRYKKISIKELKIWRQ